MLGIEESSLSSARRTNSRCLSMRPEESVTIEMNHVGRVVRDPSLGLPGKVDEEFSHDCESREAGDIDELRGAGCEKG